MSIKRFVANKDTTITDAYEENLRVRALNSNMGEADSLELFSLYGQITTSSLEKSRILVEFPVNDIAQQRLIGNLPTSGNVQFFLKMFNVKHPFTVPRKFFVSLNPLSQSWEEGYGLDMETYSDKGFIDGAGGYGTTWKFARSGSAWQENGGDIITGSYYDLSYYFETGLEDLDINITSLVEDWLTGSLPNNGLLLKMSGTFEDGTQKTSFYTKKFSARGSEFYFHRPCIEARWDPTVTDDRGNFFASSPLLDAADNTMNLYFFNKVNGSLKNIVGNPALNVQFYTDSAFSGAISASYVNVTNPLPGIYRAEVILDTTASLVYDKWIDASSSIKYFSSSFDINQRESETVEDLPAYIVNINNLKAKYAQNEQARIRIFVRERDWQPTIYTVAYSNIENTVIPNLYYKIFRLNDNYTIVDYSTGSLAYSKTSYDLNGNYFDLDMDIFEKDYGYGIKLATWDGTQLKEFKDTFKFRVE